jgi:hypothetical protein
MTVHPLCNQLEKIDFNDPANLRHILLQDKHTRVEGLCSEVIFMEDVVMNNFTSIASDFWFTKLEDKITPGRFMYLVRKIVTEPNKILTDLDYRLLDGFSVAPQVMAVSIVYFSEITKEFREVYHSPGNRYTGFLQSGEVLHPSGKPIFIAEEGDRDKNRIYKAAIFLEKRGLLKESAIKRLFANCWLSGPVWDIDVFTTTESGRIVAIEVKQKYPTRANTFGLNSGQKMLFTFLTSIGMPVIHVILRKPINDPAIHAIDLLTDVRYRTDTEWLYTRFVPEKLHKAYLAAPANTSIYGNKPVAYDHIPFEKFAKLKKLGEALSDLDKIMFAGLE